MNILRRAPAISLVFTVLLLSALSGLTGEQAMAQINPRPDIFGVYFDIGAYTYCTDPGYMGFYTVYVLLTNPSAPAGASGFEFRLTKSYDGGPREAVSLNFVADGLSPLTAPDYAFSFGAPLPNTPVMCIATYLGTTMGEVQEFFVGPIESAAPSLAGHMCYYDAADAGHKIIMNPSSGSFDLPVASLHGCCDSGADPIYVEDFTTTQYMDTANTTANWDTATGELSLLPFVPSIVGSHDTPGTARCVSISGNHAYIADQDEGLQVVDIGTPSAPVFAPDTLVTAYAVTAAGDYAYVAAGVDGLKVFDVRDPTNPTHAGSYDTYGTAYWVAVAGDYAYVADRDNGLLVLDVSNPAIPDSVGACDTPGLAVAVCISGSLAFVADWDAGLQVIDISTPETPWVVGDQPMIDTARNVAVSGIHAFVAIGESGLQVVDVGNPASPDTVGICDTPGTAYDVAVSGDRAYVADFDYGLQVIDISIPDQPTLEDTVATPHRAYGVTISGEHAFVADGVSGLQVIKLSGEDGTVVQSLPVVESCTAIHAARLTATQTGSVDWELSADGGANWRASGRNGSWVSFGAPGADLVWRATISSEAPDDDPAVTGLQIDWKGTDGLSDVATPAPPRLSSAFPNPFNPMTTIAFEVEAPSNVNLRVFDVSGRLVRELVGNDPYGAGRHEIVWNGVDDSGRQVASGAYFYRLDIGGYSETKKVTLVR